MLASLFSKSKVAIICVSLHFKGETLTPPPHFLPYVDLLADTYVAPPVTVSVKEEHTFLSTFLENVYLEWDEQPSPALKGKTPRQHCRDLQSTTEVAELINQNADIRQQGCHFQSRRARVGEQRFVTARLFFHPLLAPVCE